jgi:hypothetical protein
MLPSSGEASAVNWGTRREPPLGVVRSIFRQQPANSPMTSPGLKSQECFVYAI